MASESPFDSPGIPDVLPRGPHGLDREVVMASQRGRLLNAFVLQASEKGYYAVTIADIVREAGTAKRTFYEHFKDKQDCFVQAFSAGSSMMIAEIAKAGEQVNDPIERIDVGVRAYIRALGDLPHFTKLFLNSPIYDGPEIADEWIRWVELLADGLVVWRQESRESHPEVPPLTKMQAVAVISAINELVRIAIHHDGIGGIARITDDTVKLAIALLTVDVSE